MSRVSLTLSYAFGATVRLRALFTRPPTPSELTAGTAKDADDWQPYDPDNVQAKTQGPDGIPAVHSWLDSPTDIVREDLGSFYLDLVPEHSGEWAYRFFSTGNPAAAAEGTFMVSESAFE